MKKGVSPVVATVLLIAIAVISAVAVWYWVAPLTSSQPTGSTTQYGLTIPFAYSNSTSGVNCVTMDFKNTGGATIPAGITFEVRYSGNGSQASAGTSYKYVNITSSLAPGATSNYYILSAAIVNNTNRSQVEQGSYKLLASSTMSLSSIQGFVETPFTC
jgi:flagellin-like protein